MNQTDNSIKPDFFSKQDNSNNADSTDLQILFSINLFFRMIAIVLFGAFMTPIVTHIISYL